MLGNPTGGTVVAGSAAIGSAGPTLTINQSSNQAIINWQQFSIAGGETTKFVVPSNLSATLNRVTGGNPSAIYGSLQSNGIVYLVNPNGIVVGPSGRIDTAGFLASTLDVSNQQFLKGGDLTFAGPSQASIDNEGIVHASEGDVYLIANQVTNGGTLSAPHGTVGLAAGSDVLFQQGGNQHLFVQATPARTTRALGVTNTGTIRAAAAELRAAGGNAYALAINNSGTIAATGFRKVNGQVYLTADGGDITNSGKISAQTAEGNGGTIVVNGHGTSSKGTVFNSGSLTASGKGAEKKGGTVQVLGNQVGIIDHGTVDVSGDAGGGTALIGGDEHGSNASIANADQTYLGPDATIDANALTLGTGGKVVLWGNETTQVYGQISAKGGAEGGNGGFVETSAAVLDARTAPDLAAPHGINGTWLLDPSDVTISDTSSDSGFSITPSAFTLGASPVTISQATLLNALENGSVTIDASTGTGGSGTIAWTQAASDPMNVVNPAGNTLTLDAPVSLTITGVTVTASGTTGLNVVLNSSLTGAGSVNIQSSNFTLNGGSFTANGNGYTSTTDQLGEANGVNLFNTNIHAGGGDISLTGNAGYTSPGNGIINGGIGVGIGSDGATSASLSTTGSGNITIVGTVAQNVTSNSDVSGVNIYQDGSASNINNLTVANGTLSITGTVNQGKVSGTTGSASIDGVNVGFGSNLSATGSGSILVTGNLSANGNNPGATTLISGSNLGFSLGIEIGGNLSVTTGSMTIGGTAGTVDTSSSTLTGSNAVPLTIGVLFDGSSQINTTGAAIVAITGTGGAIVTTSAFTGGSIGSLLDSGATATLAAGTTYGLSGTAGAVNAGYGLHTGDAQSNGIDMGAVDGTPTSIAMAAGAAGSITFTGQGGSVDLTHASSTSPGYVAADGTVIDSGSRITANSASTITLAGTGGTITGGAGISNEATGVYLLTQTAVNTAISANTGQIDITGVGGDGNCIVDGIHLDSGNGGVVSVSSTAGNISLVGTVPNITVVQVLSHFDGDATGVTIGGSTATASTVTASAGSIHIMGTVTSGPNNTREGGVVISKNAQITATGTGGTAGATAQGDITIFGSTLGVQGAGTSQSVNGGVFIDGVGTVVSASGLVADAFGGTGLTITGLSNTIDGSTGATIDQSNGSGGVAFEPFTAGIGIVNGATIKTIGSAPMTLNGTGGTNATTLDSTADPAYVSATTGGTSGSYGVIIFSPVFGQTTSMTSGGLLTVIGTAGSSPISGVGVMIGGTSNSGAVSVTAGTSMTLLGTGGPGNTNVNSLSPNAGVSIFNPANSPNSGPGGGTVNVAANGGFLTISGTSGSDNSGLGINGEPYFTTFDDLGAIDPSIHASGQLLLITTLGGISDGGWADEITATNTAVTTPSGSTSILEGDAANGALSLLGGSFTINGYNGLLTLAASVIENLTINNLTSGVDLANVTYTGSMNVTVGGALTVDGAISGNGPVTLVDDDSNITLGANGSITAQGTGNNVVLAAGTDLTSSHYIINNSTVNNPIQASAGFFYLFSGDPTNDTFGSIAVLPGNTVFNAVYPGSNLPAANQELFYVASSDATGPNSPGGGSSGSGGNQGGSGGNQGGGGSGSGSTASNPPSTSTGGAGGGGSNIVPPAASPLPPPPQNSVPPVVASSGPPPSIGTVGNGAGGVVGGLGNGGMANSSGNAGQVGSGDAAQLGGGQLNNVSNPAASGALNEALGAPVFHNLQDALQQIGDFTAADLPAGTDNTPGGTENGTQETILTGGDIVVMTENGAKKIKASQAPSQLQQAMSNGVLDGMPAGAGH